MRGLTRLGVVPGSTVTLDASASTNSSTFDWLQTAGPAVALNTANPRMPTFVVPATTATLTFQLSTSGPGGGP